MGRATHRRSRRQRDYRREVRQGRRQRRSERLQKKYSYKGVWGSFTMVFICLAAAAALWFAFTLLHQFFVFLSNTNLQAID